MSTVATVFTFLLLCGLTFGLKTSSSKSIPKSGPYTTTLIRIRKCQKPSVPYIKEPIGTIFIEPYNVKKKNSLAGNLTILKDTANIRISVQDFYAENGKWQKTFNVKNLTCRSHLVSDLVDTIALMYDKKTCTVTRGTYYFEADYNTIDHLWMSFRDYGRMLRRIEITNKFGTVACLEFEARIDPEKA